MSLQAEYERRRWDKRNAQHGGASRNSHVMELTEIVLAVTEADVFYGNRSQIQMLVS